MIQRPSNNYSILIVAFFIICFYFIRIDSFVDYYFNIDEIVYLYLLKRSQFHSLPFEGFDTQTSGPVSIGLLKLFQNIGITINLINYRIILFMMSSFLMLNYTFKSFNNKYMIYIIGFTLSALFYIYQLDFLAINTEYQIISIVAIMLFILFKKSVKRIDMLVFSILLITLFLTKFQAVLLFGSLTILWIYKLFLLDEIAKIKEFILTNILLCILLLFTFFYFGILDDFYHNYILRNLEYPKLKNAPQLIDTLSDNGIIWMKYFSPYILLILSNTFINQVKRIQFKNDTSVKNILLIIKTPNIQLILITSLAIFFLAIQYKLGINISHYIPKNMINKLCFSILIILIYLIYRIVKPITFKQLISKKNILQNFKLITLLIITFIIYLSIILARYNFTHYFVLCFLPIIFLLGYVVERANTKQIGLNIIFIGLIFILQTIENRQYDKAFNENIATQKTKNLNYKQYVSKLQIDKQNETIIILGFFEAVPMYYQLSNHFNFSYRTANTQFITLFYQKGLNNQFFRKEDERLVEDIKIGRPHFIIDTESILSKISRSRTALIIKSKYKIYKKCDKYIIYKCIN